jgi:hypothetical protein
MTHIFLYFCTVSVLCIFSKWSLLKEWCERRCLVSEYWCSCSLDNFIVPGWGIKLTPVQSCRSGPPAYIAWRRAVQQLYAGVNFIPQSGTMNLATEPTTSSLKRYLFSIMYSINTQEIQNLCVSITAETYKHMERECIAGHKIITSLLVTVTR